MMRIVTAQVIDMQRDQRVIDESLKELMGQIDIELTNHGASKRHVEFQPGAAGKINHDTG